MEPSNDSFLALLEERISKRDGNSGEKLSQVAPLISKQPVPADNMSIFYTIGVRHSKSRTEIVWKMSYLTLNNFYIESPVSGSVEFAEVDVLPDSEYRFSVRDDDCL